jgi:hypothetical protein
MCCQLLIKKDKHSSRTFVDVHSRSLSEFSYFGISMQLWQISDTGITALSRTPSKFWVDLMEYIPAYLSASGFGFKNYSTYASGIFGHDSGESWSPKPKSILRGK